MRTMERTKLALSAMKSKLKRDLGFHAFMIVFCVAAVIVAYPIILLMSYLPDSAWYAIGFCLLVWILFGETLTTGYKAFRGEDQ